MGRAAAAAAVMVGAGRFRGIGSGGNSPQPPAARAAAAACRARRSRSLARSRFSGLLSEAERREGPTQALPPASGKPETLLVARGPPGRGGRAQHQCLPPLLGAVAGRSRRRVPAQTGI